MDAPCMRIGEAARRAGLSIDAIRLYERRSLLPPAPRTPSRYRLFTATDVERLHFIRRAQAMGFRLREIRQLTELRAHNPEACAAVRDLLRAKLADLRARRRELEALERDLAAALARCDRQLRRHRARCPVLA